LTEKKHVKSFEEELDVVMEDGGSLEDDSWHLQSVKANESKVDFQAKKSISNQRRLDIKNYFMKRL